MKLSYIHVETGSTNGTASIVPLNSEDFYVLQSVITPGDQVECFTTRKLSLDGGKTQQKISLKLCVKVETLEIDLIDGIMYVKGKTSKENEHVKLGSYHTLNISINDQFSLYKDDMTQHVIGILKNATKDVPEVCFIIFYEKDCVISTVSSNNIKNIAKQEVKSKNFKNLISTLLPIKEKMKSFIIASSMDIRTEFFKALIKEHKDFEKKTLAIKLSNEYKNLTNAKTVNKILTDREFSKAFGDIKYVEDLKEIEGFFLQLDKGITDFACIGVNEINEAFEYGAVKALFITDEVHRPGTVEERKFVDSIIKQANSLRAKICIIPVSHDYGERLKSLGGMAALLTFIYK